MRKSNKYAGVMALKNSLFRMISLLCIVVLSLQAQAGENSAEELVKELISAMNVHDAKRIRAVFADDATQEYQRWYARKKTGDAFWSWLQSDIIDLEGHVIEPEYSVDGNNVVVKGVYENNDGYSSAANFLIVVKDNKIASWTMRY
ncbi:nuclear transport factor 2 family protein [Pseudoalteromonas sp. GB56]